MKWGHLLPRVRAAGLLLALFALTLKALVPAGFMLSAGAGEQLVVTVCGGGEALVDLGGDDHGDDGQDNSSAHCPFAMAAAPVLPAMAAALIAPRAITIDAAPPREIAAALNATGPPLPARGPPLTA